MEDYELMNYYRRVHGIADGETYDPDVHWDVPALAFGELIPEPTFVRGEEMDPVEDLFDAMWSASGEGSQ